MPALRSIEVTAAMIEAGADRLSRLDLEWDSYEQIVTEVFEAMLSAGPTIYVGSDYAVTAETD